MEAESWGFARGLPEHSPGIAVTALGTPASRPVMLPSDIEIWESVPLPDDATLVPNNCIICSCKGMGVLALAGGDYDGDVVFFSSDRDLLEFVANTPDGLHRPKLVGLEQAVKEALAQEAPVQDFSYLDFLKHCCKVPTPNVRGRTCANAERAQLAV